MSSEGTDIRGGGSKAAEKVRWSGQRLRVYRGTGAAGVTAAAWWISVTTHAGGGRTLPAASADDTQQKKAAAITAQGCPLYASSGKRAQTKMRAVRSFSATTKVHTAVPAPGLQLLPPPMT